MDDLAFVSRAAAPYGATSDAEGLSDVIGTIYDAALDRNLWPAALSVCRDYIGGVTCCLYSKTVRGLGSVAEHYFNDGIIDPHYRELYFERFATLDPTNGGHVFAELGQPVTMQDLYSADEFAETRFYREWIKPQGFIDFVVAPIEKSGNWAMMLSVFRCALDGPVDEAARERMRLIVPHVRRAALIGRLIDTMSERAADLSGALDGLAAGIVFVDATGRIVHANHAAGEMIHHGKGIVARQGRLSAADRDAAALLEDAIAQASLGDDAVGVRGISISIDGADERYVAHVLPLPAGSRRFASTERGAAAAVFVTAAQLDAPGAGEIMAKTFGLTLAELRVLIAITQFGGVAETAEALGISEPTVKTHLQHLFNKTGASRQADLVKLLAGYSSPLLD